MTAVVLDSSVALSWCFEDEVSAEMDAIYERVRDEGGIVPGIWHLEVGNVLLQAERRGRIGAAAVAARLELLAQLPISIDIESPARA
jgi:predicted nucleic acid-binding protein